MFTPVEDTADYDFSELDYQLDMAKSAVFRRGDAAFFGPLMCGLDFVWSREIDTAGTDGVTLWWNPDFFMSAPTNYGEPKFNEFVIMHELWHVANLHMLRLMNRDPEQWNYACDIRINNDCKLAGYSWGSFPAWYNPKMDEGQKGGRMSEEEIYELLPPIPPTANPWGNGDIVPTPESTAGAVNNVVKAVQAAKVAGDPGAIPGNTEVMLDRFLSPIIPWENELKQWMTDLMDHDHTWNLPDRRYLDMDMYLPSEIEDDGRLEHLVYFQDVSGSISNGDIVRFNSELKYVWDEMKPKKMTVIQFDTRITQIDEFKEGDPFDKIRIVGRGGTSLVPVREKIIELNPTAAIIFTDMHVAPMAALPQPIPILWVATNNKGAKVPFGKLIHIETR